MAPFGDYDPHCSVDSCDELYGNYSNHGDAFESSQQSVKPGIKAGDQEEFQRAIQGATMTVEPTRSRKKSAVEESAVIYHREPPTGEELILLRKNIRELLGDSSDGDEEMEGLPHPPYTEEPDEEDLTSDAERSAGELDAFIDSETRK